MLPLAALLYSLIVCWWMTSVFAETSARRSINTVQNNALAGARNTILTSHNALSRPDMSLMHVSVLASTATLPQT